MAVEAGVPIVPHIIWGAQRIWTKDHPKKMFRPKVPIQVIVGEPIEPTLPTAELTALLHSRMQHLLMQAQEQFFSWRHMLRHPAFPKNGLSSTGKRVPRASAFSAS